MKSFRYNLQGAFGTISSDYTGRHSGEDKQRVFRGRFLDNLSHPKRNSGTLGGAEPFHVSSDRDTYRQHEPASLYPSLDTPNYEGWSIRWNNNIACMCSVAGRS